MKEANGLSLNGDYDWSQVGLEEDESGPSEKCEKYREVFIDLDSNFEIQDDSKYDLLGVIEGVKQATNFLIYAKKGEETQVCDDIEEILTNLELSYIREVEQCENDSDYVEIQYFVAKTKDAVERLKDLFEINRKEGHVGEAARELGRLLGYPMTATEYFIKRNKGEVQEDDELMKKYSHYIHSPENAETEFAQYEGKLDDLFSYYCPVSAKEFLGQKRLLLKKDDGK